MPGNEGTTSGGATVGAGRAATPSLLLIGLRASGKTSVGAILSQRLGWPLRDTDALVRARLGGATIAEVWRRLGEPRFREEEVNVLRELLEERGPLVIAAGGGLPIAPGAAELVNAARSRDALRVVYLRCQPETLRARLLAAGGAGEDRPSLTGGDPVEEIEKVFLLRDARCRALADLTLDCDRDADPGKTAARAQDELCS